MADEPVLSAATMAQAAGFEVTIPPAIVLVFDESLMPRTRRRKPAGSQHPFRQMAALDDQVSVVCAAGPGAPSAAVAMEFLAAFGAETVVAVGSAGDLHGSLSPSMHAVSSAVSDEGTSGFYSTDLSADAQLSTRLADRAGGDMITTLTTDVPFRHTAARLEQHRLVADVVEMECAAIFSVANAVGVRAGALLVVSDHFEASRWRMRDRAEVRRQLQDAVAAAVATLCP